MFHLTRATVGHTKVLLDGIIYQISSGLLCSIVYTRYTKETRYNMYCRCSFMSSYTLQYEITNLWDHSGNRE